MAIKKFASWNVNGIRATIKKDFVKDMRALAPDILCLQETKASAEEAKATLEIMDEYYIYTNSSKARKGYSGTAILTREEPVQVTYDMGLEEHDQEGRVITAEFNRFFIATVYTPNSGAGLDRLDYRETWDKAFLNYILWLNKRKPVIVCGDLNVAHRDIDIARARENYNKSAGYTQREIDGFQRFVDAGFVDTFRHFHPKEVKYTYWNYVTNGRAKNIGWRIDYFMVSERILPAVRDAAIHNEYFGSDHCPVSMEVEI
ncbi:MAG: exodeoxyribonuclease III [Cyclobacteriaceae bacterium]|nr:exodeoxyribonuclease III [Cyclobacteriaceae bacterium]MCB0500447.1 exodeoxyribonuclease III [Cyclobacteriaceae bacterium]MCB9236738.1 exodeoxyribonuclease III [Flammeovirgaceae bacterium]MCO5272377.1 exodeoxyribonuclease III [Cyclobacteriaceae bacterium]MCW5902017.1 exodeoxyribonuclease III [Cyclobacteriaceae bacterium]